MKEFLYILCAVTTITFSSCSEKNFLTQEPSDQLTIAAFYRNLDDAEAAIASAYAQIKAADRWDATEVNITVENFRDDFIIPGPDASNYPDWTALSTFSFTPGNQRLSIYWEDSYRGIFHANQVIDKVGAMPKEKIDPEKRDQIVGEGKFLRAYLHFRLLMNWDKIILRDKAPTSESELLKPLSERVQVWTLVEKDLIDAAALLPLEWDPTNKGRATKGAAIGYLGKAYLYQKKWDLAAAEFSKLVVDRIGNYNLVSNFLSNFDGTNENNQESIFEIQFTPNKSSGRAIAHTLGKYTNPSELGGWGEVEGTVKLLDEMMSEGKIATTGKYDSRLYLSLYFNDPSVSVFGQTFTEVFPDNLDKIYFRKFIMSDKPETDNPETWSYFNIPKMRYADVLLMYAEALNEANNTSGAKQYIDQVRARADMPPLPNGLSKEQMFQRIMHERAAEFVYEGIRYYDLLRWGKDIITDKITNSGKLGAANFKFEQNAYFPIPETEKNTNTEIK